MTDPTTERLRFSYQLSRGLTSIADLGELVRFATQRARELFDAEGSSLIMLDEERKELYFPVVSDIDRWTQLRVGRLRFPADQGIAGWVLQNDQSTIVNDTANDPRFYSGIDHKTRMKTQSMLCAPLRTARGNLGVIEIINPAAQYLTSHDLEFLDSIANDVAMACERARLVEQLRHQLESVQQTLRTAAMAAWIGGGGLILHGLSVSGAIPLVTGLAAVVGGVVLFQRSRGGTSRLFPAGATLAPSGSTSLPGR